MSFPNKEERAKCWGSRDEYWECLDKNKTAEATTDGPCQDLRKLFVTSCSSQWVKHFDRKRSYLRFKEKIEKEGYEPLDSSNSQAIIPPPTLKVSNIAQKRRVYTEIAI